ncbi:MAG: hypothetical protein NWF00_13000 [Candidatus Bathyarchaeota archaeon]|nr:hypothetical protein [Candidatus Bathyarchaeota archaeon]
MLKEKNKNQQRNHSFKSIICECGFEILLVPDLNEMVNAVAAHISEHHLKNNDPKKVELESERLWNLLIAQIFEKAAVESEPNE